MIETGLRSLEAELGRLDRVDRPRSGDGEMGGTCSASDDSEGSSSQWDARLLPVSGRGLEEGVEGVDRVDRPWRGDWT